VKLAGLFGMIVMVIGWPVAASANAGQKQPLLSCHAAMGDLWNEEKKTIPIREIDGTAIKDIAAFRRATGTRERGLKLVKGGHFTGWDFSGTPLHHVCFLEADLKGANLQGVKGTGAAFIKTDLTDANMQGAVLPHILFRNAKLTKVKAQGADFRGGHFDGGWFEGNVAGWNLDGANMQDFVFSCGITLDDGCPVYQGDNPVSAKGADFTGATLHSFGLFDFVADGAIMKEAVIGPGQLPDLKKADFQGDIILRGGQTDVRVTTTEVGNILTEYERRRAADASPSFDCAKATTKVEQEICGEYASDLRAADRDMAWLFKQALERDPGAKRSQRAWIRQRNTCSSNEYPTDCLRDSYSQRKGELIGLLGERDWLKHGEKGLFVDEVLRLPADFRRTGLYRRIEPALAGASWTDIVVMRGEDGLYSIRGSSVGANAHMCSLSASNLYLDKKSGWYIPVSEGPAIPIFRFWNGNLEIFESGRPSYDDFPDASDYMGCGMRASFSQTIRMNTDAKQLGEVLSGLEN
jgi:uncharacterized protein YjbI with pentapeptide repeats